MSRAVVISIAAVVALSATACQERAPAGAPPPARDAASAAAPGDAATPDAGAAAVDPKVAAGAEIYARLCAQCHGAEGHGYIADAAPSLVSETFLATATPELLAGSIALGRPGTAMGAYADVKGGPLTGEQIEALVEYLRRDAPPRVEPVAPGPGDARRGAEVWKASCQSCHGDRTTRGPYLHLGNPVLLEQASPAFLRHAIVHGRPGTPMLPFAGKLTPQQIDDVIALLDSWEAANAVAPPGSAPPAPAPPPEPTQLVLNPKGKAPSFTLRADKYVGVDAVAQALERKQRIIIVDARPASDWRRERITGAVAIPYYELDKLDQLPKDGTWIVAYCACPHHLSGIVVDELRKRGYKNTAVLDEGINVWAQRGYPITRDPTAPPIDHTGHDHAH